MDTDEERARLRRLDHIGTIKAALQLLAAQQHDLQANDHIENPHCGFQDRTEKDRVQCQDD